MHLGVDTGGTFTDFVWPDGNSRLQIHKQLSTPHDPSAAILSGVARLQVPEAAAVIHGSTVATNALLERRGAPTALITTAGFADVLAIGRQNRPDLYALVPQKPEPLVPAAWRFEVQERITAQGNVLIPLDPESLVPILAQIEATPVESVAVCLLFSFLYPEHERLIKRKIDAWQADSGQASLHVSLSCDILPEYREYERTAATVINAYVAPLVGRYLSRLAQGLQPRRLTVMQSSGGVISAATAGEQAARTVLSGPAGGVVGARFVAQQAGFDENDGFDNIITFDMGGTSTDVALCPGRLPATTAGEIAGLPLRLPAIDIHTVGAGGGSLAYVDAGGALHVGPQSAGADPGPACYGKGGDDWQLAIGQRFARARATTTDANLVLGRLDAAHFLGGTMHLYQEAARKALSELAQEMEADSPETAAWGVIQVANANMERAVRRISVGRGYDPRHFTLVAFGGAGPLHACELAQNLQIPRVLVPPVPGVLSALGMLVAAPTKDYSQTVMVAIGEPEAAGEAQAAALRARFEPLVQRARQEMAAEGHDAAAIALQYGLDMRYVGQSHELTVSYEPGATPAAIAGRFHTAHEQRYGYRRPQAAVEIVTLRLVAVAAVTPPALLRKPPGETGIEAALVGRKPVWFDRRPVATRLYEREKLQPGHRFQGPAVVFQYDTTTVVPVGWETAVDPLGNLLLTKNSSSSL